MIISKYFVGGGLWRLLNINLFITSTRPLKSIFSLFWLYIWDHYIHNLYISWFISNNETIFSIIRLIMMSLWRHSAPNFTESYIFWKFIYLTIKLVNCFYFLRYFCVFCSPVIDWRVNSLQETIARHTIELYYYYV
jgi:hypothetical protein